MGSLKKLNNSAIKMLYNVILAVYLRILCSELIHSRRKVKIPVQ